MTIVTWPLITGLRRGPSSSRRQVLLASWWRAGGRLVASWWPYSRLRSSHESQIPLTPPVYDHELHESLGCDVLFWSRACTPRCVLSLAPLESAVSGSTSPVPASGVPMVSQLGASTAWLPELGGGTCKLGVSLALYSGKCQIMRLTLSSAPPSTAGQHLEPTGGRDGGWWRSRRRSSW